VITAFDNRPARRNTRPAPKSVRVRVNRVRPGIERVRCELERGIATAGPSHPIGSSARCRRADRLLAVGAALGFGQQVAALLSPVSSPFLAVGDTVINYSPEPVTEFAKVQLGTNDKAILLSGMAVVIALVAVRADSITVS
jgi:hypothetical protein